MVVVGGISRGIGELRKLLEMKRKLGDIWREIKYWEYSIGVRGRVLGDGRVVYFWLNLEIEL